MLRKRYIAGVIAILAFTALALYSILGLPKAVDQIILDSVWLDPEKVDQWGQNPGKSKTVTIRNYTFYNFTNPHEFLYHNHKPIFTQINSYLLQERTNFTNLTYSEDQSIINFTIWLHFTQMENSRNLDEEVNVLNLGPLGFWNQILSSNIAWTGIQAFGGFYYELSGSLKNQAIGQGVLKQYLPDYNSLTNTLCVPLDLTPQGCKMLWSDPLYGLQNTDNYQPWINWSLNNLSSDGRSISEYFGFTLPQLQFIKQKLFFWSSSMNSILENWYCKDEKSCTSSDMMIMQMTRRGITANPPSGDAVDSVCQTGNVTCSGWPELINFYKYVFLPNNTDPALANLTFSDQLLRRLFTPYTGALLNVGNQSAILKYGQLYDLNPSNLTNLNQLLYATMTNNYEQAIVVYKYYAYFVYQFGMKLSKGGSRKMTGYAQTFVKYFYKSFNKYNQWLLREYMALLVGEKVGDCGEFIKLTVEGLTGQQVEKLCQGVNRDNYGEYYRLVEPCHNPLTVSILKSTYNLTNYQIEQYCDPQQLSLGTILIQVHKQIKQHFNCQANKILNRCTSLELTTMQLFNSTISLNPIQNQLKNYTPSTTAKTMNSDLPPWEYRHFLKIAHNDTEYDSQQFSYRQAVDLLSFNKLFSNPMVQNILLDPFTPKFQELYYWKNRTLLVQWIRYFVVQAAFGGLVQKRKVRELLFGYEDPFIKEIKQGDLMRGGDPSRDYKISLNQPNKTLQQASEFISSMYTGKSDPYLTRNFITKDGSPYVEYQQKSFNGYEIISKPTSPFRQWLQLKGSDGMQIKPLSQKEQLQYIYIDSTKRISEMQQIQELDRYGFNARRYQLTQQAIASSKKYPPNDVFYQGFTGFINASFKGAPLFISGNHFLRTDPEDGWNQKLVIYDENGTDRQLPSDFDRSELVVESRTGALMTGTTYLQTNLYFQPDLIFNQTMMLPLFTVYRSGNMSEQAADDILGQLKIGMRFPKIIFIVSIIGIVGTGLAMYYCLRKLMDKEEKHESLLESVEKDYDEGNAGVDDKEIRQSYEMIREASEMDQQENERNRSKEVGPQPLNQTLVASVENPTSNQFR